MSTLVQVIREAIHANNLAVRVASPAIVQSFDPVAQTVVVVLALKRKGGEDTDYSEVSVLLDVPVLLPSVAGFHITLPIQKGDECLVVFSDRCIDSWFDKGGVQQPAESRVHHISDGFAFIGVNSKPNTIPNFSASDLEIRNDAGTQLISLKSSGEVLIETDGNVTVNTPTANFSGDIIADGDVVASGVSLVNHTHGGVEAGGSNTGVPN